MLDRPARLYALNHSKRGYGAQQRMEWDSVSRAAFMAVYGLTPSMIDEAEFLLKEFRVGFISCPATDQIVAVDMAELCDRPEVGVYVC